MIGRRLMSTGIVTLWLIFLFLLSIPIREDISHFYHYLIGSTTELPALTKAYSMRILGAGNYLASNKDGFFYLFWGFIWAVPLIILFFSWRLKEPSHLTEFLLYSWLTYLLLSVFLFFMAIYGLLLPFLHL
jgi:hypothetical protein